MASMFLHILSILHEIGGANLGCDDKLAGLEAALQFGEPARWVSQDGTGCRLPPFGLAHRSKDGIPGGGPGLGCAVEQPGITRPVPIS